MNIRTISHGSWKLTRTCLTYRLWSLSVTSCCQNVHKMSRLFFLFNRETLYCDFGFLYRFILHVEFQINQHVYSLVLGFRIRCILVYKDVLIYDFVTKITVEMLFYQKLYLLFWAYSNKKLFNHFVLTPFKFIQCLWTSFHYNFLFIVLLLKSSGITSMNTTWG